MNKLENYSNLVNGTNKYNVVRKFMKKTTLITLEETLKDAKLFVLDEELLKILFLTDNKSKSLEFPFPNIFIETSFMVGNKEIKGLLIRKRNDGKGHIIGHGILKDNEFRYNEFGFEEDDLDPINEDFESNEILNDEEHEKIINFLSNFLNFLNHPDVEVRVREWPSNEAREKRGKTPIPDQAEIKITGKLYRYIYEELPKQEREAPKHSFWVRGHFRNFLKRNKWNRIYKLSIEELNKRGYQKGGGMGTISKWILPYIKGQGILINKNYHVEK